MYFTSLRTALSVTRSNQLSSSILVADHYFLARVKYQTTISFISYLGGDTGTRTLDPLLAKQVL